NADPDAFAVKLRQVLSDPAGRSRSRTRPCSRKRFAHGGKSMLLERKNAIIYGGGGAIGSAVARAFAAEGARVYLAGRTLDKLEETAQAVRSGGGQAHTAQL